MGGWFKLHRKIIESAVFADPEKLKAWVWILSKAGFKPKPVNIKTGKGSRVVNLKKGEFVFGRYTAAEDLCLSPSKCWRIMKWFESEGMILIDSNSQYSLVNVVNYSDYQDFNGEFEVEIFESEQPMDNQRTADGQPTDSQRTATEHKEEGKEGGKGENEKNTHKPSGKPTVSQEDVDYIYSLYPTRCTAKDRSTGKGEKSKNKIKQLLKGRETVESLEAKISWYLKDKGKTGYLSNFNTFLNNLPDEEEVRGDSQGRRQEVNDVIDYVIKTQNVTAEQVESVYRKITEKKIKWSEKPELLKLIFEYGNF